MEIVGILIFYIVMCILAVVMASNKGRSKFGWFLAVFFLTPFVLLILLALPSKKVPASITVQQVPRSEPTPAERLISDEKKCPDCAEMVKKDAKVCKHCRHEFAAEKSTPFKACVRCKKMISDSLSECPSCGQPCPA